MATVKQSPLTYLRCPVKDCEWIQRGEKDGLVDNLMEHMIKLHPQHYGVKGPQDYKGKASARGRYLYPIGAIAPCPALGCDEEVRLLSVHGNGARGGVVWNFVCEDVKHYHRYVTPSHNVLFNQREEVKI